MRRPLLLVFLLLLGAAACLAEDSGSKERVVSPEEVLDLVSAPDGPLLLDVRSPEEFAGGHVPGALLIPVQDLEKRLAQLEPYRKRGVITYCERGGRAERALEILRGAGFSKLAVLEGNMSGWRSDGRNMEKP